MEGIRRSGSFVGEGPHAHGAVAQGRGSRAKVGAVPAARVPGPPAIGLRRTASAHRCDDVRRRAHPDQTRIAAMVTKVNLSLFTEIAPWRIWASNVRWSPGSSSKDVPPQS